MLNPEARKREQVLSDKLEEKGGKVFGEGYKARRNSSISMMEDAQAIINKQGDPDGSLTKAVKDVKDTLEPEIWKKRSLLAIFLDSL